MKNIREYRTYREFLQDSFLQEKLHTKGITLVSYARSFELSAPTLQMIFTGKRNLTVANIHKIAFALRLSESDHEYFEMLVHRDQCDNAKARDIYTRRLRRVDRLSRTKSLRVSDKRILLHPRLPALLIYLIDFMSKGRPTSLENIPVESLALQFGISAKEVREALLSFEKNGLLAINSKSHYHVVYEKVAHHLSKKEFLKAVLSETVRRIDENFENPETHYFRSFTLSIANKNIQALRNEIGRVFEKYISKDIGSLDSATIIQSFVGIFPAVKNPMARDQASLVRQK